MKNKRFITVVLIVSLVASNLCFFSGAEPTGKITGETSRTTTELTLADGTKTGVKHTNIQLSGYYGNNREINIAEGDLSNTNLSLEIVNSGTYMIKGQAINKSAEVYNSNHPGQTVLAAVNGDFYMTSIHSGPSVAKSVLSVPRGVLIVDGEIWSSAQTDQENIGATNVEQGTSAGYRQAFGVTDLNQPVIGIPIITTTLDIDGTSVATDGINRIPAMDSIMVYNHRVNSSNYALNDSYEVELVMHSTSALKAGGTITGTIVSIYESGSTVRPSLANEKTIVLTARGSRIEELKALCAKGKRVTLKTELVDMYGNTDIWQKVQNAVGGQMQVLYNDIGAPIPQNTYYPTTLVGYKDDGSVALVTVTSTKDNSRAALKISQSYELCRELGYNSAFYLDGGGSTTFVTLEEGSYTVRNKCSDGSARAVRGGIGFVWHESPVCMRQGNLNHMEVDPDYSEISPIHIDGAMLDRFVSNPNDLLLYYSESDNYLRMTTTKDTIDPFATLDYSSMQKVSAEEYPYLVFKLRTTAKTNKSFAVYYSCGSDTGPREDRKKVFTVSGMSTNWQYVMVYMADQINWSGNINNIRLDVFNEATNANEVMDIASVTLCKNIDEITALRKGTLPQGACSNFAAIVESFKPTPYFVAGDITNDGLINSVDLFKMKLYIKRGIEQSPQEEYASDVNGDHKINAVDAFEMRYRLTKGQWRY